MYSTTILSNSSNCSHIESLILDVSGNICSFATLIMIKVLFWDDSNHNLIF